MRLAAFSAIVSLLITTGVIAAPGPNSAGPTGAAQPRSTVTRQNAFSIPFRLSETATGQAAPREVQLFYSADHGASWKLSGTAQPQARGFAFRTPRDGEYWFSLHTVYADGKVYPAGPHSAQLQVMVDTVTPRLDLVSTRTADGGVLIQWQAADPNLDPGSLKIETSTDGGYNWRSLAVGEPSPAMRHTRSGHATLWPPLGSKDVLVRAEILDSAQNRSASQSSVSLTGALAEANRGAALVDRRQTPAAGSASVTGSGAAFPTQQSVESARGRSTGPVLGPERTGPTAQRADRLVSHPVNRGAGGYQTNRLAENNRFSAEGSQNTGYPPARSGSLLPGGIANNDAWPPSYSSRPLSGGRAQDEELPAPSPDIRPRSQENPYVPSDSQGPNGPAGGSSPRGASAVYPNPTTHGYGQQSEQQSGPDLGPLGRDATAPTPAMSRNAPFQNAPATQDSLSGQNGSPGNHTARPQHTSLAGSSSQSPQMVNSGTFELEYDVESIGPEGIAKVELWATRDGGQTWSSYGVDEDFRSPFRVNVMQEGTYGFRVVIESANGLGGRRPNPGEPPDVWIGVDMTRPTARITSTYQGQGNQRDHLVVTWEATDAHLASRPVSLFYATSPDGPWSTVAAGLENTGQYAWRLPRETPDQFYLRIEVRDEAGNITSFTTPEPVTLSRPRPEGHIRGVRPVLKSAFLNGPAIR